MTAALHFDPIRLPPVCQKLREEVRAFLAEQVAQGVLTPHKPHTEDTYIP